MSVPATTSLVPPVTDRLAWNSTGMETVGRGPLSSSTSSVNVLGRLKSLIVNVPADPAVPANVYALELTSDAKLNNVACADPAQVNTPSAVTTIEPDRERDGAITNLLA